MTAAVQTIGLTKRYETLVAVDRIDMTVERGDVYGLLGPNGAGKTTTLRMLLGLVRPTAGSVRILGAPADERHGRRLERVGALVEAPAFDPSLTGRDNLRALADQARLNRVRVDEVLELVGLGDRSGQRYVTYSRDVKQLLGLAAALLKWPDLLMLDEPSNDLDPSAMAQMRDILRSLADGGCTVLLSSHLIDEVRQTCDRVGVIAAGQLLTQCPIRQLGGAGNLRVVVDQVELARDKAVRMLGPEAVTLIQCGVEPDPGRVDRQCALDLDVEPGMVPLINRALVAEGIAVRQLSWHRPDLEQVLSTLTRPPDNAARTGRLRLERR